MSNSAWPHRGHSVTGSVDVVIPTVSSTRRRTAGRIRFHHRCGPAVGSEYPTWWPRITSLRRSEASAVPGSDASPAHYPLWSMSRARPRRGSLDIEITPTHSGCTRPSCEPASPTFQPRDALLTPAAAAGGRHLRGHHGTSLTAHVRVERNEQRDCHDQTHELSPDKRRH